MLINPTLLKLTAAYVLRHFLT